MGVYDKEYKKLVNHVLDNGVETNPVKCRAKYEDGTPANTIESFSYKMRFPVTNEAFFLTTRRSAWKSGFKELINWMWQQKSNDVEVLKTMGVNIWNEWQFEDGTIGKSYGYQLGSQTHLIKVDNVMIDMSGKGQLAIKVDNSSFGKEVYLDQVDYVLHQLKANPESRRIYTTVRHPNDVKYSSLDACVHTTEWVVLGDTLHLEVNVRSNDIALGNVVNVVQYQFLHHLIAHVSGYKVGEMVFEIVRPHIYVDHLKGIKGQMQREELTVPTFTINPELISFYDATVDDIIFEGDYEHHPQIKYRVGI